MSAIDLETGQDAGSTSSRLDSLALLSAASALAAAADFDRALKYRRASVVSRMTFGKRFLNRQTHCFPVVPSSTFLSPLLDPITLTRGACSNSFGFLRA